MSDTEIFVRQNPRTCLTIEHDQIDEYVSHHAGGLRVMDRWVDDKRIVKMHDSWGGEDSVVVHVYDPENADDPDEIVKHFSTGAAAFEYFKALPDGEASLPPAIEAAGLTMTAGEMIRALEQYPLDKPLLIWDEAAGWYRNVRLVELGDEDMAITIEASDNYDTRQW